jgi:hypothetical protein
MHCLKAAHTTFEWVVHLLYIWEVWLGDRSFPIDFFVLFISPSDVNAEILLHIRL